jgi:hypothetical protein
LPVADRLIPYIQLYEFEALLFSDPNAFVEEFPDNWMEVKRLQTIRDQFGSPEEINEGPNTHLSRRILDILPDYQKPVAGILIAKRIGTVTMRRECPHFNEWLRRILALAAIGADPDPA